MARKQDWSTRPDKWVEHELREMIEGMRNGIGYEGTAQDFKQWVYNRMEQPLGFEDHVKIGLGWNSGYITALLSLAKETHLRIDPALVDEAGLYVIDS